MSSVIRRIVTVVLAAMILAGCSPSHDSAPPQPPTYPNWPDLFAGFRFRWSAAVGIDLLTGPAVPLRAFLESVRVGESTEDLTKASSPKFTAYPGFFNAVSEPTDVEGRIPFQITQAWPFPGAVYDNQPLYGNEYFHVLQIDPIDGGYRAYVCDGRYNVFLQDRKTKQYLSILGPGTKDYFALVRIWRVELRQPAAAPAPVPQKGPNPAPLGDEFGTAKITASSTGLWGMRGTDEARNAGDVVTEQHRRCLDLMPDSATDMVTISRQHFNSPPPFKPPVPGWPAQAS
jgi:hypothetical protein